MIAVVDAGMGNLRSVMKAFEVAAPGHKLVLTADPEVVRRADRVVVPGQGAFGDASHALSRTAPLGQALVEAISLGTPYLGICLGLQILFEGSDEAPACPGLGILGGRVLRIPDGLFDGSGGRLKVPHMGWNDVRPTRAHPLLHATWTSLGHGRSAGVPFYFVHSYHAAPAEPFAVAASAGYGTLSLAAVVTVDNVCAVQFHPEKSQRAGLAFLAAFVGWRL